MGQPWRVVQPRGESRSRSASTSTRSARSRSVPPGAGTSEQRPRRRASRTGWAPRSTGSARSRARASRSDPDAGLNVRSHDETDRASGPSSSEGRGPAGRVSWAGGILKMERRFCVVAQRRARHRASQLAHIRTRARAREPPVRTQVCTLTPPPGTRSGVNSTGKMFQQAFQHAGTSAKSSASRASLGARFRRTKLGAEGACCGAQDATASPGTAWRVSRHTTARSSIRRATSSSLEADAPLRARRHGARPAHVEQARR